MEEYFSQLMRQRKRPRPSARPSRGGVVLVVLLGQEVLDGDPLALEHGLHQLGPLGGPVSVVLGMVLGVTVPVDHGDDLGLGEGLPDLLEGGPGSGGYVRYGDLDLFECHVRFGPFVYRSLISDR